MGRLLARHQNLHKAKIDAIVPVPIHPDKKAVRGYNQSEMIANGLAEVLETPVIQALYRESQTVSQTKLNRVERWDNVKDAFSCKATTELPNHILLVDDTLTTGATLEACAVKLLEKYNVKISVATLGYASG